MTGYVTVDQVKAATGARPGDFGDQTSGELNALLEHWIANVKGLIDEHYTPPRDFLAEAGGNLEAVPRRVRHVAEIVMGRIVNAARSNRESALIRLDDWRVGVDLVDEVFPPHVRALLPPRQGGAAVRMFVAHGGGDG